MREVITSAALDEGATTVVLGDSTGHLRVLDISAGIDVSSPEAAAASFKQVGSPAPLMGARLLCTLTVAGKSGRMQHDSYWRARCTGLVSPGKGTDAVILLQRRISQFNLCTALHHLCTLRLTTAGGVSVLSACACSGLTGKPMTVPLPAWT